MMGVRNYSIGRAVGLVLIISTTAFAQDQAVLKKRVLEAYDALDAVILPPHINATASTAGIDFSRDNLGEVKEFLESNPDAPYICAALFAGGFGRRFIPGVAQLRAAEMQMCMSHQPTNEQLEQVRLWVAAPPLSPRQQIASNFRPENLHRFVDGIYIPPPASPSEWLSGNAPGRDYRADLQTAFDRDPLLAAYTCVQAQRIFAPNLSAQPRRLHAILTEVCNEFPDAKIEAAAREKNSENARAWLNGLMNSMLDAAAPLSNDARRQEVEELVRQLPRIASVSTRGFEAALRIIAFVPDDWRGPATALTYKLQPTYGAHASVDVMMAWLRELYAKQIAGNADPWPWKRGQRGFLTLTGDFQAARQVAAEVAAHARDEHALDTIYLAMIDRALGNRAAYDRLMNDCPAPDPRYLQKFGAPPRSEKYCQDVVAEFARAVRDQLENGPAVSPFAQMYIETNRVPSSLLGIVSTPPSDKRTTGSELDDWFSSLVRQEEDAISKMDKVQREEMGARLSQKIACMCVNFQEAIELTLLRPWHEGGAAQLVYQAHMSEPLDPVKEMHIRKFVGDFISMRATSARNAAEWKRSLRAFYLFTGDYTRARDLSHELIKSSEAPYATRDAILLGLTERVLGIRKPLDEAIANCPGTPKEELDRNPNAEELHNGDYCRNVLNFDLMRAIYTAQEHGVPHAFNEILAENAAEASSITVREFALEQLTRIDPQAAAIRWRELLDASNLPEWVKQSAFMQLAKIAEKEKHWAEGIQWIDRYIDATTLPASFAPNVWNTLAQEEEVAAGMINEVYSLRLRLALAASDFENARRTIEDLAARVDPSEAGQVRSSLLKLANAEIDAGRRDEPLRIIGYISRSALSTMTSSQLADTRRRLAAAGEKREPQRENSPWDSPPRRRQRITGPSPTVTKS